MKVMVISITVLIDTSLPVCNMYKLFEIGVYMSSKFFSCQVIGLVPLYKYQLFFGKELIDNEFINGIKQCNIAICKI